MKTLALFNASFNPPGLHHRRLVDELARQFDAVVVVPCGPRPDKPTTNDTRPIDRAVMADLTFTRSAARVDLFDLEAESFTLTHELGARFGKEGQVWHVVGAEQVRGGGRGQSIIHRLWQQGEALWAGVPFAVVCRPHEPLESADLPPQHRVITADHAGSAAAIRVRAFRHHPIDGLVDPRVADYIGRRGLYRGGATAREARWRPPSERLLVVADERNPAAVRAAEAFRNRADDDSDLIVVCGGDGTMLHAIRRHWRLRRPFFGVNTGHVGFLLNAEAPPGGLASEELVLYQLPLLRAEVEGVDGTVREAIAFNDAWVERAAGQTAWVEVRVNGAVRLPKVVADGVLVSTAAGSTSYARAMGAPPLPLQTPALVLIGSNVLSPYHWRPVVLGLDAEVELRTLDPVKRPLHGYIDGVDQGPTRALRLRVSRTAAVELAFRASHDPAAKLGLLQFPTAG
jgi:NAD kinase